MRSYPFTLLAAAAILLPSCVRWNLGENLLTARETRVGLDYTRPVDGKIYCVAARGRVPRYYARLPEVRFRVMPALVQMSTHGNKGDEACGIEPTGREAWAEVRLNEYSFLPPERCGIDGLIREVDALPSSATALAYAPKERQPLSPKTPARLEEETSPGPLRRAAAATLSYTIDPALTAVSTTALGCGECALVLVASPFLCVYYALTAGPVEFPAPAEPTP